MLLFSRGTTFEQIARRISSLLNLSSLGAYLHQDVELRAFRQHISLTALVYVPNYNDGAQVG